MPVASQSNSSRKMRRSSRQPDGRATIRSLTTYCQTSHKVWITLQMQTASTPPSQIASVASSNAITTYLIYLLLFLFPLQVLAISVATTKLDLSNLVFLVLLGWVVAFAPNMRSSVRFRIVFTAFAMVQIAAFLTSDVVTSRFISGFVWIGGLFLFWGYAPKIRYNITIAYNLVLVAIGVTALSSIFEYFILDVERPAGLMSEPSPAGMVMLSCVAGIAMSIKYIKNPAMVISQIGLAAALLTISILLKTTHFVTFGATIALVAVMLRALDARTVGLGAVLVGAAYLIVSGDSHYLERLDVSALQTTNVSLLAWLQGFDQMIASLSRFPLTGASLGGTGSFYFYSPSSDALAHFNLADLNRSDAFSGFFRLVIEIGPIFTALLLYSLYAQFRSVSRAVGKGHLDLSPQRVEVVFLLTFATGLILGTLLKEPTWSRSTVVVAIVLLATVPRAAIPGRIPVLQARRVRSPLPVLPATGIPR